MSKQQAMVRSARSLPKYMAHHSDVSNRVFDRAVFCGVFVFLFRSKSCFLHVGVAACVKDKVIIFLLDHFLEAPAADE